MKLSTAEYEDRVQAVWIAQMVAAIMGFQFEHHTASVEWVDQLPEAISYAPVDDDWYYEMAAIRAFEKYGIDLTVQQLGEQWKENACGSWGSSEQTRLLINRGILPPESGHPRYNKLWFSIGPQFSADVYGALAPGLPNVAAKMAREFGHINGYGEGTDGAVFMAGMVSLGFSEKDPKTIVRKAARLIHPQSPYRKCIDFVIQLADAGKSPADVFNAIEDRWHIEYPATNNAVPNGGIVAASLWFGEADFLKTVNLAFAAADFTDADCNAANAGAVLGAMFGLKAIPDNLVKSFGDRIKGEKMGGVVLTPAVDESISGLSKRTVAIGKKILEKHGVKLSGDILQITTHEPITQPAELFQLSELSTYWNPDWTLERAGFGGAGGGMSGIRGNTYLDGDVLATYPRDEIRGLVLSRKLTVKGQKSLSFDAGVDANRAWNLDVFIGNKKMLTNTIEGGENERHWQTVQVDISSFEGKTIKIRLYQRVLLRGKEAGNAYWKNISIK
ncbi:MAG: ADP-ribosylglycohydrolase family protein [Chitinophagaceae bacterium]